MSRNNDPDRPRSMSVTLTDDGDSWLITVDTNRIGPADSDICSLAQELAEIAEEIHKEGHLAQALAERRN